MDETLYYLLGAIIIICVITVYNYRFDTDCECDSKCTKTPDGKCDCNVGCKCGCRNTSIPEQKLLKSESTTSVQESKDSVEGFFGGYYYPYDYPYYWPYFYSGCNETIFGDIKCLPFYANPFW